MINLYCIRHGESTHNVLYKQIGMKAFFDINHYDTNLTDLGMKQSINLGNTWAEKNDIDLVIVSSLTRTLQTCNNIFKGYDCKIIALDYVKEYPQGKHTCNKRTSKTELMKEYPNIDFSYLESDEDEMWKMNILESVEELLQRINKFYDWIEEYNKKYNYKNIALISHNGIISMMKDQKFNYQENGDEELKYCHPYKLRINLNSK